jgi:amidase
MPSAQPTWLEIASERKRKIEEKIPLTWRVNKTQLQCKSLVDLPETSGLLTDKELVITGLGAVELLAAIREQKFTATETTIAFCKRAAIAHQAVRYPSEIDLKHVLTHCSTWNRQTVSPRFSLTRLFSKQHNWINI